jgi:hypothetical protein
VPRVQNVEDGLAYFNSANAQGNNYLGIGSPIDPAKAISILINNPAPCPPSGSNTLFPLCPRALESLCYAFSCFFPSRLCVKFFISLCSQCLCGENLFALQYPHTSNGNRIMKHKKQPQLQKKILHMKDNHTWKAPKGYKIVMLDRGAVSFNVPEKWIVAKTEPFEMNDRQPPNDNARLTVSYWRFTADIDWTGLPLAPLLEKATADSKHELLERGEIKMPNRSDLELVWVQNRFQDPVEPREAYTRIAMARGFRVHVLITFDYWVDEAKRFLPVWEEAIRSLQLGRVIEDPTKGPVEH